MTKQCKKCGTSDRYKNGECKVCKKERTRKWRQANPEKVREYTREWQQDNPEKVKESNRNYRQNNPEKVKETVRQWREGNPERAKEATRKWQQDNPEKVKKWRQKWRQANPEKVKKHNRKYRLLNPEKTKNAHRQWVQKNRKKVNETNRKYSQANPEQKRQQCRVRRARLAKVKSAPYSFPEICNHYGNKCLRCGRTDVKLTDDHVIPLFKGGPDVGENIQPLCGICNSKKGIHSWDFRPDKGNSIPRQLRMF